MIEGLPIFTLGLFAGLWGGAFLGFLQEWSATLYIITTLSIGGAATVMVIVTGPSEVATSVNWTFQIGVLLGSIVGAYGGSLMYRDHWPTA